MPAAPVRTRLLFAASLLGLAATSHAGVLDNIRLDSIRQVIGGSIQFIEPPAVQETANYRSLVLQHTAEKNSEALQTTLQNALKSLRVNQAPYFREVGTTPPAADALKERKWATLEVSATQWAIDDSTVSETRNACTSKVKMLCKDEDIKTVSCKQRTVTVSGKVSLRDTATNAVLTTDSASESLQSKACADSGGEPDSADSMVTKAADAVAAKLIAKFTPRMTKRALDLIEDDSSLAGASEKLKQAYRLASGGNVQVALKLYHQLIADGMVNGVVLFNAAYCEQALGHFKAATELYKKAKAAPKAPLDKMEKLNATASDYVALGIETASD